MDSHSSNASSLQIAILEVFACHQEKEGREPLVPESTFNYFKGKVRHNTYNSDRESMTT